MILLAGCTEESSTPLEVTVEVDPVLPTVLTLRWTTPEPSDATIIAEDGLDVGTWSDPSPSTDHVARLPRLPAGASVDLSVTSTSAATTWSSALTVDIAAAPDDLPVPTLTAEDAGFDQLLVSLLGPRSSMVVLDRHARAVAWHLITEGLLSTSSTLNPDGNLLLANAYPDDMLTDEGDIEGVPLSGGDPVSIPTAGAHHDFLPLPDGRYAWLGIDVRDWGEQQVMGDTLLVGTSDADAEVVFDLWDHLSPAPMCSHFAPAVYAGGVIDWGHFNSVRRDEDRGWWLLMSRNYDEIFVVDDAGAIVSEIGGATSDWTFAGDDPAWDHGHFSEWTGDRLYVFDNGMHRDPPLSRAVRYAVDVDTQTLTLDWSAWSDRMYEAIGDVRGLDNGDTLVAWPDEPSVEQIDDAGEVRWRVELGEGFRVGHILPLEDGWSR